MDNMQYLLILCCIALFICFGCSQTDTERIIFASDTSSNLPGVGRWYRTITVTDEHGVSASMVQTLNVYPKSGVMDLNQFRKCDTFEEFVAMAPLWGYGWPKEVNDKFKQ